MKQALEKRFVAQGSGIGRVDLYILQLLLLAFSIFSAFAAESIGAGTNQLIGYWTPQNIDTGQQRERILEFYSVDKLHMISRNLQTNEHARTYWNFQSTDSQITITALEREYQGQWNYDLDGNSLRLWRGGDSDESEELYLRAKDKWGASTSMIITASLLISAFLGRRLQSRKRGITPHHSFPGKMTASPYYVFEFLGIALGLYLVDKAYQFSFAQFDMTWTLYLRVPWSVFLMLEIAILAGLWNRRLNILFSRNNTNAHRGGAFLYGLVGSLPLYLSLLSAFMLLDNVYLYS